MLSARTPSGEWNTPAFVTLTGGSIGWQFGAEAADIVLVFGNDRSVRNMADGRFTLGGDAAAVAGPLGRRTTAAVTGKSEVYIYTHSRGLFAGAAFEGARLDVDEEGNTAFYGERRRCGAAADPPTGTTPASASGLPRHASECDARARERRRAAGTSNQGGAVPTATRRKKRLFTRSTKRRSSALPISGERSRRCCETVAG